MLPCQSNRRQPGTLIQNTGNHLPKSQLPGLIASQRLLYPQSLRNLVNRPYRTYGSTLLQRDIFLQINEIAQVVLVLQRILQSLNLLFRTTRQVGYGAILYLALLSLRKSHKKCSFDCYFAH